MAARRWGAARVSDQASARSASHDHPTIGGPPAFSKLGFRASSPAICPLSATWQGIALSGVGEPPGCPHRAPRTMLRQGLVVSDRGPSGVPAQAWILRPRRIGLADSCNAVLAAGVN